MSSPLPVCIYPSTSRVPERSRASCSHPLRRRVGASSLVRLPLPKGEPRQSATCGGPWEQRGNWGEGRHERICMQEACALERTRPGRRALPWFANPTSREAKCVFLARPAAELRGTECRATRVGPCDGLAHGTENTARARAAVAAKVRAEVRTGGHHFVPCYSNGILKPPGARNSRTVSYRILAPPTGTHSGSRNLSTNGLPLLYKAGAYQARLPAAKAGGKPPRTRHAHTPHTRISHPRHSSLLQAPPRAFREFLLPSASLLPTRTHTLTHVAPSNEPMICLRRSSSRGRGCHPLVRRASVTHAARLRCTN